MYQVTIKTKDGVTAVKASGRRLLSDLLSLTAEGISLPCSGKGICGKCKVTAMGQLSDINDIERAKLTNTERENNMRLACQTFVTGDSVVMLADTSETVGLVEGSMVEFNKNPITGSENCYGIAIDIGTTTIAAYLYKFPECTLIKQVCVLNNQTKYGADVISRIEYTITHEMGTQVMQDTIVHQIEDIVAGFADGVEKYAKISTYVLTGNTTMLHFVAGLRTEDIAKSPFVPTSLFGTFLHNAYFPPCISAYVGADIVCAVLASGMVTEKGNSLLVDIGTNGEMALFNNNRITCCSTAAGPCFEGVGIEMGSTAYSGAICKAYIYGSRIYCATIDGADAVSICGTGIIDVMACMLKLGIIDETGYLESPYKIGDTNVYIYPKDVRAIQLVKSSIRSGLETLVHECGITFDEIESLYVAGSFGSLINIDNCVKLGLFPDVLKSRAKPLGNASGSGACMILQSKECLEEVGRIAKISSAVELSTSSYFGERYIENMIF